jgi:hypothetical protein
MPPSRPGLLLMTLVFLASCGTPPPPPPPPPKPAPKVAAPRTEEQLIYDDTITVCDELARGKVEIWKHITYQSRTWKALAVKVDEGSRAARCEMGKLMQKHKGSSRRCTQVMVEDLISYCGAPELPVDE